MRRADKNRKLADAQAKLETLEATFVLVFGNNTRDQRRRKAEKTALKELTNGRSPTSIRLDLQGR